MAPTLAAPCALDGRRRRIRAVATTGVLALFLFATPVVVALALGRVLSHRSLAGGGGLARGDVVPLFVILATVCAWLPGAVAVVGELRRRDRPGRRSRIAPPSIQRVVAVQVEASLLGAGTLRGWTTTRVDGSLTDLELPGEGRASAASASEPPDDLVDALRRRQPSAGPAPGALGPIATSPPRPSPTTAYLVQRGDTWWELATRFLGDGRRFAELKELNLGRLQPDGSVVHPDTVLRGGWTIDVPTSPVTP